MSNVTKFKSYKALRLMAYNQMVELKKFAQEAVDDATKAQFNVMYQYFDTIQADFRKHHQSMISLGANMEEVDIIAEDAVRTEFEFFGAYVSSAYKTLFENLDSTFSKDQPSAIIKPNVRLPKLEIPRFSGDIKAFKSFFDMFSSLVHNNATLSDIEKFNYLISFLEGPPLTLIQSIPMTTDNYDSAYTSLIDRYDNKRLIAFAHLQAIDNAPFILQNKNAKALRSLIDVFSENISALKNLSFPTDEWDFILFYTLSKHLDHDTLTRFEIEGQLAHNQIPTFESLKQFVLRQCNALDAIEFSAVKPPRSNPNLRLHSPKPKPVHSFFGQSENNPTNSNNYNNKTVCSFCKGNHLIYKCNAFRNKTPIERLNFIKSKQFCTNCLSDRHAFRYCNSQGSCRHCQARHHSLLHVNNSINLSSDFTNERSNYKLDKPQISRHNDAGPTSGPDFKTDLNAQSNLNQIPPIPPVHDQPSTSHQQFCGIAAPALVASSTVSNTTVLLSTAIVGVLDGRGNYVKVRVLLDCGSQSSYISQKCFNRLGIKRFNYSISIHGLGHMKESTSNGCVSCTLKPVNKSNPTIAVDAIILQKLCPDMPPFNLQGKHFWPHISDISLADEQFNEPRAIDMILGADVYPQILLNGRICGSANDPMAINTVFGWVLIGKITGIVSNCANVATSLFAMNENDASALNNTIKRFWEIEEIPKTRFTSPDEDLCEKIFQDTHIRTETGRYQVELPFKGPEPIFDYQNTRAIALRRFYALEKRLSTNNQISKEYSKIFQEYLDLNYLEEIPLNDMIKNSYYIPHHCVIKPDKIRVVYDASTKTQNGYSLNDNLLVGAKLQKEIVNILLNFRLHHVVFTCDIKSMFTQILVNEKHRDFQRIVYRFSPHEPVKDYRLTRVTFGLSCSPFLANRTIVQLVHDEGSRYPLAAKVLESDCYVDDCCSGTSSVAQAKAIRDELIKMLKSAGFELRKWSSNCSEFLEDLPESHVNSYAQDFDTESLTVKVLGLRWQPSTDSFNYHVEPLDRKCTKRNILSEIARIFDPLGFLTPLTIFAKQFMQTLWSLRLDWDEQPPVSICSGWLQFKSELLLLRNLELPRRFMVDNFSSCELHGFCDASQKSYACVVYFRFTQANNVYTFFVMSKSKVSPLKQISIPRLELCAATLLAEVMSYILRILNGKINAKVVAWSDSTVVLNWINSPSYRWRTFVANRVARIQSKMPSAIWRHVASEDNPADCASRGLMPSQISQYSLWWAGPAWLQQSEEFWPKSTFSSQNNEQILSEEKKASFATFAQKDNFLETLINNFSSLLKIQNILCYIMRYIYNCKNPQDPKKSHFSFLDLDSALFVLIKHVQHLCFAEDISNLKTNKRPAKYLRKLNAFLDKDDILRVGGRLSKSSLTYDQKHPAILPRNHRLTMLIIEYFHKVYLHPGMQQLQFLLAQRFWILSSKRAIRQVIGKCKNCWRLSPQTFQPPMGNLPPLRVSQVKPFSCVAIDYAGYFITKETKIRSAKTFKSYVCIFVCFASKAIHLELVSDLSSEAFLCAFRRFLARRGRCVKLYSDCGTNFVGAFKELKTMFTNAAQTEHIEWHFNPPSAPHFNGLAESGVKSVKTHIRRVVGDQILTIEEFATLLCQIEAVLNSRPLCPLSMDPNDLSVLTPGHFLTLEPLSALPDPDLSHLKLSHLDRWQMLQRLHQNFWVRWSQEYLHTLQQRGKWLEPTHPKISVGTMVIIKNDVIPPLKWPLGRITALHPGEDGTARVATVLTKQGYIKRPLVKLCPLPYMQ